MTLSLALLTKEHVIVATDRRISSGRICVSDEYDKTFVLVLGNARLACSFSGLAKSGKFNAHEWLLTVCPGLGAPTFDAFNFVKRLTTALTDEWRTNKQILSLSASSRRFSFMLAGFETNYPYNGIYAIISNWENAITHEESSGARESFELYIGTLDADPECVTTGIGQWRGIPEKQLVALRDSAPQLNHRTTTNRMVRILEQAADNSSANGTIGKQITTIRIPKDCNSDVLSDYHVGKPTRGSVMPACVWSTPQQRISMSNISIRPVEDSTPDMLVPTVGRSQRCPCGSGKKFKNCHGATSFR